MPEAALSVPGWYGKLPHVGDFVSRRLPEHFIRGWDEWLQGGLQCARDQLGPSWLEHYLVAPIYRFWIDAGLLGHSGWAGVLMPSVDRVGRHFPLTIALPLQPPRQGLASALAAVEWFAAVDAVARLVLDVDFSVDDLERRLAAIAASITDARGPTPCPAEGSVWWCDDAGQDATWFKCFSALPPATSFVDLLEP